MLMATDERPGIDEKYERAGNTSRLLLEEHRTGAADVLASAGMAQQFAAGTVPPAYSMLRTGMALMRLAGDFASAGKPQRRTREQIERHAAELKAADDRERASRERENGELDRLLGLADAAEETPERFDLLVAIMEQRKLYESGRLPLPPLRASESPAIRAQREADRWYASELRLLAVGLKSRGAVWAQLSPWAAIKGHDPETVAEALLHWLSPVCDTCDGHGLRKVPNSPNLSARQCHKCSGTGHRPHPAGSARVLAYLDAAVVMARNSIKKRLRPE